MHHFAFLSPPYAGHFNPMLALAEGLVERGHRVTFVAQSDAAALVRSSTIGFATVGASTHPPGELRRMTDRLGATTGLFGIGGVIADVLRTTTMLCRDGPDVLRAIGATAIVGDQTEAAAGLIARHLALPQISVANALLIDRDPGVPPPFVDWIYDDSPWGLKRNRGGYRIADLLMKPLSWRIRRIAGAWSLPGLNTIEDCLSPLLEISQTMPGFDFPRLARPATLLEVGPLRHSRDEAPTHEPRPGLETTPTRPTSTELFRAEAEPAEASSDLSRGDCQPRGRPTIFCSLGTLQGGRFGLFRVVAEACRDLDLDLVVAHGGKLTPAQEAALPGSPRVAAFLPQREVIARSAAVVTHGGLNTVLDACAAGVPLVVLPIAFEQGAIGARVAHAGAGRVVPQRRTTAAKVQAALADVLGMTAYRQAASRLRDAARAAGGVRRAVESIEAVLAGPAPARFG